MKVILMENIENLGNIGDVVTVSDGYGRNFLIPRKKAARATTRSVNGLEHQKRLAEIKLRKERDEADKLKRRIESVSLTIPAQVGEGDKLYGSVTNMAIQKALITEGIEIDRRHIVLDEPIKNLGIFTVTCKLSHDVQAQCKVWVVKE
ncbi:MAG: 50S ribosomal protein L9 [Candidatus Alcyoniella australis]|nr:50S ribosomal protein L9 [Candidatus Alcyoniella australis]